MADELCACGRTKSEHGEIIWVKPKKEGGKTLQRWVAKGQGMCSRCSCAEFKKKEKSQPHIKEKERKKSERKKALVRREGPSPSVPSRERSYF